jgi:hypothetical protein
MKCKLLLHVNNLSITLFNTNFFSFAMKVIRRSKCKPNELLILNKIDSPFLIKLHDEIFDDDDAYFIITEFCEVKS